MTGTGRVLSMERFEQLQADGIALEMLNNGIQLSQWRREFASLRCLLQLLLMWSEASDVKTRSSK